MTFQPQFPRIVTLSIASVLLIIAAASLSPVCGTELKAESDAERFVLEQVQNGDAADLDSDVFKKQFPNSMRELRGTFVGALLTPGALLKDLPDEISIVHAAITGNLDLQNQEIPYEVSIANCVFEGIVDFTDCHFARGLSLSGSKFKDSVDFSRVVVGLEFDAEGSEFSSGEVTFLDMQVGRDFGIASSTFGARLTSFANVRVSGDFEADGSEFRSEKISFAAMRVDGSFAVRDCTFNYDQMRSPEAGSGTEVNFSAARFTDVFMDGSGFGKGSTVDFRNMKADYISFNKVDLKPPKEVRLGRMEFKFLSPTDPSELKFLLLHSDAEFYTELETSLRTHGYADDADTIFIAKKYEERQQSWRQGHFGDWSWNLFEDWLVGYGKKLKYLLVWSLVFLLLGVIVFRSEKGMRLKAKGKDAVHYERRYNAFWYSLDLFLPIIKLGEADVWTPKDDRRWANLYRKVHIIIGSLFVPIGLAAWTGIIK